MFNAMGIAGSGVGVYRKWLDAISDNISNMNDASPTSGKAFQARYVEAQAVNYGTDNGGVRVSGNKLGSAAGRIVHDPSNPIADKNGNVRYPDIDLSDQMGQLIMAQRGYQANLQVVTRAQEAYRAALQLGQK